MNAIAAPIRSRTKANAADLQAVCAGPLAKRSVFADLSDQATGRWLSAIDLLRMQNDVHGNDIMHAADSLADLSADLLDSAIETYDPQRLDEAHGEMRRTAALLSYRITDPRAEEEEVRVLKGIHFLMESSMELVMEALKHRGEAA